jgi:hypothetical protein
MMSLAGRWMRRDRMSAWTCRQLTARPPERLFRLVLEPHAGRAQCRFRREARTREHTDAVLVDSLKALDPNRPIREADIGVAEKLLEDLTEIQPICYAAFLSPR